MVKIESSIIRSNGDVEQLVSLSAPLNEHETQYLKFYSDDKGFFIGSSVVEQHGDEPTYFSCQLTKEEFKILLSQLTQLVQDKQS